MKKYKYKAFISYKHSIDRKNAEKIEFALKKYGKSWYSPIRKIFRDEKILTFTNDLGNDILDALNDSEFLIYLASPEGAQSQWVELELDTWCNKLNRCDKLIIILTKGQINNLQNNPNQIDWDNTNVIPSALKSNFTTIPYYRNISKLKKIEQLEINNPDFNKIVNSIVAKFEGIKPGEMIDEARSIYKKNLFYRSFAISLLIGLTIVSTFLYFKSQSNLKTAKKQTKIATQKELEAKQALFDMKIAQENEALQKFNDLEKRVKVIKDANADPTILINKMIKIAKNHNDSISLSLKIVELIK